MYTDVVSNNSIYDKKRYSESLDIIYTDLLMISCILNNADQTKTQYLQQIDNLPKEIAFGSLVTSIVNYINNNPVGDYAYLILTDLVKTLTTDEIVNFKGYNWILENKVTDVNFTRRNYRPPYKGSEPLLRDSSLTSLYSPRKTALILFNKYRLEDVYYITTLCINVLPKIQLQVG